MARYAFTSGNTISPSTMQKLADAEEQINELSGTRPPKQREEPPTWENCAADLAEVHANLCDVIAPAVPRTILLLQEENSNTEKYIYKGPIPLIKRSTALAIGPVPIVRRMMGLAIV